MKTVIAYSLLKNTSMDKIKTTLNRYLTDNEFEIHQRLSTLLRSLKQPGNRWRIAILMIDNMQQLDEIISIKEIFADIRIILVLPYCNSNMVTKGYQLIPRLVTYSEDNFEELNSVLGKMIQNIRSNKIEALQN